MASSKNVRKLVVDASNDDDYVGPITRSRSKALDQLQPQPTKEGKLHTTISLDFLANRKATTKDSSTSKDLEISNESSPTKTFFYQLFTRDEELKEWSTFDSSCFIIFSIIYRGYASDDD